VSDHDGDDHANLERILRPEPTVLEASAIVPNANRVDPAPTTFTHATNRAAPYSYESEAVDDLDHGELAPGTEVVVVRRDGRRSWVVDGDGLAVQVQTADLDELDEPSG
jgi:hypothetical protein